MATTTPIPNENYDVVSVLYHLLEGSDTIEKYCNDADNANDQELRDFFQEIQESNNRLATRAQEILKARLQ